MKKQKSIRFPQTFQLRPMLGLNAGKLPKDERWINFKGLRFHLKPSLGINRRRPHRLEVECNVCKT